jgi:hypothetical protein
VLIFQIFTRISLLKTRNFEPSYLYRNSSYANTFDNKIALFVEFYDIFNYDKIPGSFFPFFDTFLQQDFKIIMFDRFLSFIMSQPETIKESMSLSYCNFIEILTNSLLNRHCIPFMWKRGLL